MVLQGHWNRKANPWNLAIFFELAPTSMNCNFISKLSQNEPYFGRPYSSELNIPRPNIQLPEYSGIFNENSRSKMGHFVNIQ